MGIFSASEVVELGIQIEKNGRDFYNMLVKQAKSDAAQNVFLYLAGEEEKHITVFQKILEKTEKYEPAEVYSQQYSEYMRLLASENIFTQKDKGQEIARTVKTDREAVELGIGFEKDSILFYEGMERLVPDYDKKIISELTQQEKLHLKKLSDLRAQV